MKETSNVHYAMIEEAMNFAIIVANRDDNKWYLLYDFFSIKDKD